MASTRSKRTATEKNELATYIETREALIKEEKEGAWDYAASSRDLAPNEKIVAQIVRLIREFERRHVFGNLPSEDLPAEGTLDMGGQFLTNKACIEKLSLLFKIAKQVPKGSLLHLHFNAELNPERLLEQARDMSDTMYVWSIKPLRNKKDLQETEIVFKIMPSTTNDSNIFDSQYEGKGKVKGADGSVRDNWRHPEYSERVWMRWESFRKKFEECDFAEKYERKEEARTDDGVGEGSTKVPLGTAENWILSKMLLSELEAYGPEQTVNGYVLCPPEGVLISLQLDMLMTSRKGLGSIQSSYTVLQGTAQLQEGVQMVYR